MVYTTIYLDKHNERKWKQTSDIEEAEKHGKQMSDNNYDICVSLHEYNRLKDELDILRGALKEIETMCRNMNDREVYENDQSRKSQD